MKLQSLCMAFFIAIVTVHCSSWNCTSKNSCPKIIQVAWWDVAPYIYLDSGNNHSGIFSEVMKKVVAQCCGTCSSLQYRKGDSNSEDLKKRIDKIVQPSYKQRHGALYFPVYGEMTTVKFQSKSFFPIVESPGIVFIQAVTTHKEAASHVLKAIVQGWPILVLTLIMALLSGMAIWALDSYWNPKEFPSSFFKGSWEGFWWAFVSMTTVGYGDRAPRSVLARIYAFFWVLVGLVIISIFTATVTTSLTALSLSNNIKLYGNNIVALNNTEEERYGVKENARVYAVKDIEDLKKAVKGELKPNGLNDGTSIKGGLIDSYVAGHNQDQLAETEGVKVGNVIDHQYAYGFVTGASLEKTLITNCFRRVLSVMEGEITEIIQKDMNALPEPAKSPGEEKSSNLFNPTSPLFLKTVFGCLGTIFFFTICGIGWEYCYWQPKLRKNHPKTTVKNRLITPKTSLEELVTMQCHELEEAMMKEVISFYQRFNQKLTMIKHQYTQGHDEK